MLNLSVLALRNTETEDEMRTLIDISRRYKGKKYSLVEVGLEDYFFVLRWFNNHYNDGKDFDKAVFDGLKWIFLDAIYNDGKIESIYESMDGFKKELNRFDTIFTVNYDTNLDQLSEKQVFHLHGSFTELDDTYRPETLIGELACIGDKKPTIVTGMEHIYCNAIMGFSGAYKMEQMMKYEEINKGIANYAKKVHEYPLNEFKEMEGELHIIGMSPCNDSHIINMINENANIVRVIFYCTSAEVFSEAKRVIKKPLQMRNVIKYWQSL